MNQYLGLIGVVIGWGLSALTELIRHRWSRREKIHDLLIERGEGLLESCGELVQWIEDATKAAFQSEVYLPLQLPTFRVAAIVELYFPSLSAEARKLDEAAIAYRSVLVELSTNKRKGQPMTAELNERLQVSHQALQVANATLLTNARKTIRGKILVTTE